LSCISLAFVYFTANLDLFDFYLKSSKEADVKYTLLLISLVKLVAQLTNSISFCVDSHEDQQFLPEDQDLKGLTFLISYYRTFSKFNSTHNNLNFLRLSRIAKFCRILFEDDRFDLLRFQDGAYILWENMRKPGDVPMNSKVAHDLLKEEISKLESTVIFPKKLDIAILDVHSILNYLANIKQLLLSRRCVFIIPSEGKN